MSGTGLLATLTVVLAVIVVLVLAAALIEVRRRLLKISGGLATLATVRTRISSRAATASAATSPTPRATHQ